MTEKVIPYLQKDLTRRDFLKKLAALMPVYCFNNKGNMSTFNGHDIYLTFDDGYSGLADKIQAVNDLGVPATFFLTGGVIRQYPDQVRLLVETGHSLRNHTDSHSYLTKLGKAGIISELARCEQAAQEIAGVSTLPFMRPPYGAVNEFVHRAVKEAGYEAIKWTQDTRDWAGTASWYIASRITPGVILMHTQGRNTVKALYEVIPSLLKQGYNFAVI